MGFRHDHARVADIIEHTAKQANEVPAGCATEGFNGLAVDVRLAAFCKEVRRIDRRVQFGVNSRTAADRELAMGIWISKAMEVWAYIPGQAFAIMRLGHKDHYAKGESKRQYGVHSRLISNGKFKGTHNEYHTAMSEDMSRALVNVKKYFRPYTVSEMIDVSKDFYLYDVTQNVRKYVTVAEGARHTVAHSPHLMPELAALVESGYEFKSPLLRQDVMQWMTAEKARIDYGMQARHAWFVHVYERLGKQHFDVVEMFETHRTMGTRITPAKTYTEEDLPEEIAGRLAVLMMAELETYVPDVGKRDSECTFYIDRSAM